MRCLAIIGKRGSQKRLEEIGSRGKNPFIWKSRRSVSWFIGASLILAASIIFSGCSTTPQAAAATNKPAVTVAATLTVPATSAPQTSASATPAAPNNTAGDLVKNGEQLYQKTAGNIGCAGCHGADAKGGIGPDVRGKTASDIKSALENVNGMKFIKMSDDDINAVAAYLQSLASK